MTLLLRNFKARGILPLKLSEELLAKPSGERENGIDPRISLPIITKSARRDPYFIEVFSEPELVPDKKRRTQKTPQEERCAKANDLNASINHGSRHHHLQ